MAAIKSVTVINNRTNKEVVYESTTEFGLDWQFYNNNTSFALRQLLPGHDSSHSRKYNTIAILLDFSIIKVIRFPEE